MTRYLKRWTFHSSHQMTADVWIGIELDEDIHPDVITYTGLISAEGWTEEELELLGVRRFYRINLARFPRTFAVG